MISPLIIFGATGVGKTSLLNALHLYQSTDTICSRIPAFEVIVADSRQVYKDMPISTAQTHATLQAKIPHHLAETLDCFTSYTVGTFVAQTNTLIQEIHTRNNIPIIMGGTAYYIYNLYKGMPTTPVVPHTIHSAIIKKQRLYGTAHLYKKLCTFDPLYAKRISPHDTQRIIRAIEVYQHTQKPLSTFDENTPYNTYLKNSLWIGLERNRNTLYHNINIRVDTMYKQGLFNEAYSLWKRGLNSTHNAFHTIGIQEILENTDIIKMWNTFNATLNKKETISHTPCMDTIDSTIRETVLATIKKNTRRYAKRQLTFFQKLEKCIYNSGNRILWFNLDKDNAEKEICKTITVFIEKNVNN